jgi:hypothetical protein
LKAEGHIKKNSFKLSDLTAENITFFIEKHNALKRSMKMTTVFASNKQTINAHNQIKQSTQIDFSIYFVTYFGLREPFPG